MNGQLEKPPYGQADRRGRLKKRKLRGSVGDNEIPVNPSEVDFEDTASLSDAGFPEESALFPPEYPTGSIMGPSNAEDPYLVPFMNKRADTGLVPFITRAIRPVTETIAFDIYQRDCECDVAIKSVWNQKYATLNKLVDPFKEQLIALYFRFIDWTYPAVDKKRFYGAYFHHVTPLNRGLICAMLGLGCTYWKYSTQLCTKVMPPCLVADLWQMSLYHIQHDISCHGASLDTITAMLLYLQKRLPGDGIHEQITSRIHVGTLVSTAFSLGLNVDCSEWDISETEKSARRRLWALIFYSEKWSAANLGHPSILPSSCDSIDFSSHHPQERWFVQLVKVTKLLSVTLTDLYFPKKPENLDIHSFRVQATRAENILAQLKVWHDSLTDDLRSMGTKNELKYCSNGMLHLCALSVEVLVFRKLLDPTYGSIYRSRARDLVQKIFSFCVEITHSHLHAFWISTCRLSLSSLAHFVLRYHAQSSEKERKKNTSLMRSWVECLRSLSHGWDEGIGLAHHRMDALFFKGNTQLKLPLANELTKIYEQSVNELLPKNKVCAPNPNAPKLAAPAEKSSSEEPLEMSDLFLDPLTGDQPSDLVFDDGNLHDLLYDLIWE